MSTVSIALIGDYTPDAIAHLAIPQALYYAGKQTNIEINFNWLNTISLQKSHEDLLAMDGIWCVPASPYKNEGGVLEAIRYARTNQIPFLGTCGGYQHALIEFTRNELGIFEADHSETNSQSAYPLISKMACSLIEVGEKVSLVLGTTLQKLYNATSIEEKYHCSYGLNTRYISLFDNTSLKISAFDNNGETKAFELLDHPFFIGTAFQPERLGLQKQAHPLISAFVKSCAKQTVLNNRN